MKNNKGITLIALTITIVVLLILASITVFYGKDNIDKANLENLKTNMLLIDAKAKEYCEEANFKIGTNPDPSQDDINKRFRLFSKQGISKCKRFY